MRAALPAQGVLLEGRLVWDSEVNGWSILDETTGESHPLAPEIVALAGEPVRVTLFRLEALQDLLVRAQGPHSHEAP